MTYSEKILQTAKKDVEYTLSIMPEDAPKKDVEEIKNTIKEIAIVIRLIHFNSRLMRNKNDSKMTLIEKKIIERDLQEMEH